MADFVSHHLFGGEALSVFPAPAQRVAAIRPACFYWGCQGPDPLFYRKVLGGSPLHKVGNRMHSERTTALFSALSRAVHCLSGTAGDMAQAYFYGFLCHYALDSVIHPYVYCRQEQIRAADPRVSGAAVHCQIESDIDFLLYQDKTGCKVTAFDPDEQYQLAPDEVAVLSCLLHTVLRCVYGEDVPTQELRRAFSEMRAWENFLYSESRAVYHTARGAERLLGRGALLTGHMKVAAPDWDALNEEHAPWRNLWRPEEVRTESVPELLSLARIRAAALAGQYAAQLVDGWFLRQEFDEPFDSGNPKMLATL